MKSSYSIGRISGIPVRLHISLLIFLPLFALMYMPRYGVPGLVFGLLGMVIIFASILLHELGHSLVARAKGARIVDILLLPFGGMTRMQNLPTAPRDEIAIAAAGPAVSFLLGLLCLLTAPLAQGAIPLLGLLLHELGRLNILLALFNLIPSFPMDGGRIFRAALVPKIGRAAATRLAARVARVVAILFGIWAILPLFRGGTINIFLLMIAFFVYQAATAEERQAAYEADYRRHRDGSHGTPWRISDEDVQTSSGGGRQAPSEGMFDDLYKNWQ